MMDFEIFRHLAKLEAENERLADEVEALQARVTELENLTTGMATHTDAMVQTAYTERDAALGKLEALEKQGPVAYQFQTTNDGKWHDFLDEKHYLNTVEDGRWPIRALHLAPVPAKTLTDERIRQIAESVADDMWPEVGYVGWTSEDKEFYGRFAEAVLAAAKGGV